MNMAFSHPPLFPFSAVLGHPKLRIALLIEVIDPKIGGLLVIGEPGLGKSTIIRSIIDLLPQINIFENTLKPMPFYTLPLGATEEMVIGTVNLEKLLRNGEKRIESGILTKANGGFLYIDEINLLPDYITDLILDTTASGVNLIEREGVSLHESASFGLIASMNLQEGTLRPQISERFSIEIHMVPVLNVSMRATLSRQIMAFHADPVPFLQRCYSQQQKLRDRIQKARENLENIQIPSFFFSIVGDLGRELGIYSHRIELALLRSARALAALHSHSCVNKALFVRAFFMVVEDRIRSQNTELSHEGLNTIFERIWRRHLPIPPLMSVEPPVNSQKLIPGVFQSTNSQIPFQYETLITPDTKNWTDVHAVPSNSQFPIPPPMKDQPEFVTGFHSLGDYDPPFKSPLPSISHGLLQNFSPPVFTSFFSVASLHELIKQNRRVLEYTGRGSRVRLLTHSQGRFVFTRTPRGFPHSIAFEASIKAHHLNYASSLAHLSTLIHSSRTRPSVGSSHLAVQLSRDDLKEKIKEVKAPYSFYFIVDASASMRRTLDQTIRIISSVHAEGYKKKDKISVISFQGRSAMVLQHPSVSLSVGLQKLRSLEGSSYTPLASALRKVLHLIHQEQMKGICIPIMILLSDLGANVSSAQPHMNAATRSDFDLISSELGKIASEIGKKRLVIIIMKPRKSFATQFLGVDIISMRQIESYFRDYAHAHIIEYDAYDTQSAITLLKQGVNDQKWSK